MSENTNKTNDNKATSPIDQKPIEKAVDQPTVKVVKITKTQQKIINLGAEYLTVTGVALKNLSKIEKIGEVHDAFKTFFKDADDEVKSLHTEKYGKYFPKSTRTTISLPEGAILTVVGFIPSRANYPILKDSKAGFTSLIPNSIYTKVVPKNWADLSKDEQKVFMNAPLKVGERVTLLHSKIIWWDAECNPIYKDCTTNKIAILGSTILNELKSGLTYKQTIEKLFPPVVAKVVADKKVANA